MIAYKKQALVVWALVRRDLTVLRQQLWSNLVDSTVKITSMYIALGILGPYFGFTSNIGREIMVGAIASVWLSSGFAQALEDSFDMSEARIIDYKRTLPVSTAGILLASLCSYTVTLFACTFPLFILAKFFLGAAMPLHTIQWIPFLCIYFLSMVCVSAGFLITIFYTSFNWFRFNIWQQVLIPMNSFGCLLFAWKRLDAFSPLVARIILLNPFTFFVEGLRAALFGNEAYISVYYCLPVIFAWTVLLIWILVRYASKRVEANS